MSKAHRHTSFTKTKNYLMEAIYRRKFSSCEFRILLCLMRRTYGWRERRDGVLTGRQCDRVRISLEEIAEDIGIGLRAVKQAFSRLRAANVITRHAPPVPQRSLAGEYGINSDDQKWKIDAESTHEIVEDNDENDHLRLPKRSPMMTETITHDDKNDHLRLTANPHGYAAGSPLIENPIENPIENMGLVDEIELSEPEEIRKLQVDDEVAFALAGRFLQKTFSVITSPIEDQQLRIFLSDEAPNGYKLAVLVKSTQALVAERAELKAAGNGRFVSSRPVEKAISAAAERLAHNRLRAQQKRQQKQRQATQPGIGASETIEQYKRRIGAV